MSVRKRPEKYLAEVREQYERYPYPQRDPAEEKKQLRLAIQCALERLNHFCFRGKNDFQGARALVAGGGTGDALISLAEQLRPLGGEVDYVDISEASMAVARERAKVRGLKNVRFHHGSLEELGELGLGAFDVIECYGVLHHLEEPEAGLAALRDCLKPEGCMALMVYASYGRTGVYHMQELMQLINKDEPAFEERVARTRAVLKILPGSNLYKRTEQFFRGEYEQWGDVGLYDLFLHSQDRSYTVEEVYELVEGAGLNMVGFCTPAHRMLYRPEHYVKDAEMRERIGGMPRRKQEAIAELLVGIIRKHEFYVTKGEDTVARYGEADYVPFYSFYDPAEMLKQLQAGQETLEVGTPFGVTIRVKLDDVARAVLEAIDGKRSFGEIFEVVRQRLQGRKLDDATLFGRFEPVYRHFNDGDILLLRHKSVPRFASVDELHRRTA